MIIDNNPHFRLADHGFGALLEPAFTPKMGMTVRGHAPRPAP
jgi:hypothetical protein